MPETVPAPGPGLVPVLVPVPVESLPRFALFALASEMPDRDWGWARVEDEHGRGCEFRSARPAAGAGAGGDFCCVGDLGEVCEGKCDCDSVGPMGDAAPVCPAAAPAAPAAIPCPLLGPPSCGPSAVLGLEPLEIVLPAQKDLNGIALVNVCECV